MAVKGGQQAVSAAVRQLRGSRVRPHHKSRQEPSPVLGDPPKPDYLGHTAAAHWDYLAGILRQERRLTLSDGPWLTATAEAYAEYRRLHGLVHSGSEEKPPEAGMRLAQESYRKFLAEGGLTPLSRIRVSVTAAQETDAAEEFLRAVS